jgi:large subunit ribosomal protein L24
VVEGVNVAKKATKPNPMTGATGGIVDKTDADSRVQRGVVQCCDWQGRPCGFKEVDGKKVRVFKSDGEVVKA